MNNLGISYYSLHYTTELCAYSTQCGYAIMSTWQAGWFKKFIRERCFPVQINVQFTVGCRYTAGEQGND